MALLAPMQEWITVGVTYAGPPGVSATQAREGWLDVTGIQDIVLYVLCSAVTNAPNIAFQTSPTDDESLFMPMAAPVALAASVNPAVTIFQYVNGTPSFPPLAAWLRWQVTPAGAASGSATFQITASLNPNTMGRSAGGGGPSRVARGPGY